MWYIGKNAVGLIRLELHCSLSGLSRKTTMSQNQIAFGVGCFHFGYHPQVGSKFTGEEYISQLDQALATIPNIEKIEIDIKEDSKSLAFEIQEQPNELCNGINDFPFTQPNIDFNVQLLLFIPERVQNEFKGRSFFGPICERFIVDITCSYYFPITIVRSLNPPPGSEPSDGVYMCREFLKKSFKNSVDKGICFESLGPSPFHAEFFLEPNKGDTLQTFEFERIPVRGYDDCYFRYNPDYFDNIEEAYQSLIDYLDDQIGLFYLMHHLRYCRDAHWMKVYNSIQQIIKSQRQKGILAYWRNTLTADHRLHDAMLSMAEVESSDIETKYNLNREMKELYLGDNPPELIFFLKESMREFSLLPFRQMRDVLNLLESRRAKRMRLLMMPLSAVLGGAVGALLTLLLKR
jgi:hypothetical protein